MNLKNIKLGIVLFGLVLGLGIGMNINAEDDELNTLDIERVSISSEGVEGNNHSVSPSISKDGRYIAFMSGADNLVVRDDPENNTEEVYLRDMLLGTTEAISVSTNGSRSMPPLEPPAPDSISWSARTSQHISISADGSTVAFSSLSET